MVGEGARGVAVVLVADHVGEVLLDAAAVDDVQDLHPAADAQDGHPALDGGAHQGELVGVALLLHGSGLGVGFLAVERGVHVARAAGDDQGVDDVQHPVRILRILRVGEQAARHDRRPSGRRARSSRGS